MVKEMNRVQELITLLGGAAYLSKRLNVEKNTVLYWAAIKRWNCGTIIPKSPKIPQKYHDRIRLIAKELNVKATLRDFMNTNKE